MLYVQIQDIFFLFAKSKIFFTSEWKAVWLANIFVLFKIQLKKFTKLAYKKVGNVKQKPLHL